MNVCDGTCFNTIGMVNQVFCVGAELFVKNLWCKLGYTIQIIDTIFFKTFCNATTNVPNICNWPMVPQLLFKSINVQITNVIRNLFRSDIKGNLGQK